MALLNLKNVWISFGGPPLLEGVDLQVERGERLGLVGRNGSGKSTLLRVLAGEIAPDQGEAVRSQGLTVAALPQDVPQGLTGTVYDVVAAGLGSVGEALTEYHRLGARLADGHHDDLLRRLDRLQQTLDARDGWRIRQRVETVLTRMNLNPDAEFSEVSAGLKRRVLLARALVSKPDILILDEPTNHLDIAAITWLEDFLLSEAETLVFVTHDRMLLKRLATRIIEIDRGGLTNWACGYDAFLDRRRAMLETESEQQAQFDKKLAQEEAWLTRGIKARRTRNEGRVRALEKMRELRAARRERMGLARLQIQEARRSGKLVVEAEGVGFSYPDALLIRDFSATILRGDKVGVIGPNGSGKSTLLRILLGDLAPQTGRVRLGAHLEIAYFDQLRLQLDEERTVQDNVADGNDRVTINGQPRHIVGYLKDFLFSPERARTPVHVLSGGERNRLLLAKLFAKPANVLVMDEPTNDLDTETLELLEELIIDYQGTVLLVTHDRAFLNNVVTSTLVFEGDGRVCEYVGGYDDWVLQRPQQSPPPSDRADIKPAKARPPRERPRKLTFKEERELEALPPRIEALEAEQQDLYRTMADPAFYQQGGQAVVRTQNRLDVLEQELAEAYQRWEILEELREQTQK